MKVQSQHKELILKTAGWFLLPCLLLLCWHITAQILASPWILPTPGTVLGVLTNPLTDHYSTGSLLYSLSVSLLRVTFGFTLAALLGITIGLVIGIYRPIAYFTEPLIEILRPLCPIAWLPFAIAIFKLKTLPQLFGIDYSQTIFDQIYLGMIFVLFWGGFFPVLINTIDGARGVRRSYIQLAKSLGANNTNLLLKVYIPAALPMIITGLRQGLALCWFVIIAAEMLPGTDSGIGYLLIYAADQSDMAVVIACMVIIGLIGAVINISIVSIMKVFVKWHGKEY